MPDKARVLVTRRLPDAVEQRLQRDYDARLNTADEIYGSGRLLELAAGVDAIIPCHTERLDAELIAQLPESVKAICSFSVGYDHIDLDAARARGRRSRSGGRRGSSTGGAPWRSRASAP